MAFTLIYGPMKSGKSLELISRVAPYTFAQRKVVYAQPAKNVRDAGISSRLGVMTKAFSVDSLSEITDDFDVIGIDEIHMFPMSDVHLVEKWIIADREVFISGLDLDYRGKMPPIILALMELKPHELVAKVAVCDNCHRFGAQFSQILEHGNVMLADLPMIVPEDGTYEYQARCRDCFVKA